jgi:drug/metabolite transporter (DMT)-like permease
MSTSPAGKPDGGAAVVRPDAITLVAFAATAVFAGANAVAIRIGFAELAPFWGAGVRFLAAAVLLLIAAAAMRLAFPVGRALVGATLYGLLNFGLSYAGIYWALTEVTAATTMVVLAIVPLLTFLFAVAQKVERFNPRALAGALMAAGGIAIVFGGNIGAVSWLALAALLGSALCIAQVPIIVKTFPRVHPVLENGIGMAVGGALLLLLSLALSEPRAIPADPWVQGSFVYLVLVGSIGVFLLYLFVLGRWTASASSYILLLAPLAAGVVGYLILGEPVSLALVAGGALVLAGVYVGAIAGKRGTRPPADATRSGSPGNR